MLKKNRYWHSALFAVIAISVVACGSGSSGSGAATSASGGAYAIGWDGPLTGALSPSGRSLQTGVQTYLKQVNDNGGINGHKVDVTYKDDQGNGTTAVGNVKQLQQQNNVSAILGLYNSAVYGAVQTELQSGHTPGVGRGYVVSFNNGPYLFGTAPPIQYEVKPALALASTLLTQTSVRVAVTAVKTPATADWVHEAQKDVAAKGWTVSTTVEIPNAATGLESEATALAASKPDVVLSALLSSENVEVVKALRQKGFTGPVIAADFGDSASMMKTLSDAGFYGLHYSGYPSANSTYSTLKTVYKQVTAIGGDPDGPEVMDGYGQAYVLTLALKKCGYPCSGDKLNSAFESLGVISDTGGIFGGPIDFSSSYHLGPQTISAYRWESNSSSVTKTAGPFQLTTT